MRSIALKIVAGLIGLGVIFSVVDYLAWRQAELGHYGQGATAAQPTPTPLPLANPYQSDWAGLRIAPPQGFNLTAVSREEKQRQLVLKIEKDDVHLTVWVEKYNGDLIGAAEAETGKLPGLARERQYLNTDRVNAVVLTWQEDQTQQRALFVAKEKLVVVEAAAPTSAWSAFEPTFWQVLQSVVLF